LHNAALMDARSRQLLEMFDAESHAGAPDGALDLASMGSADELRPIAEELVARGWLRRGDAPGSYARTEDGRLALAGPLDVTLYTRPGCHLCEEAKQQIAPLLRGAGARLREINIDQDPAMRERYNVDVPVIFLGARKVAKHRVDLGRFRRQLEDAKR
jgi:glutaredoxin